MASHEKTQASVVNMSPAAKAGFTRSRNSGRSCTGRPCGPSGYPADPAKNPADILQIQRQTLGGAPRKGGNPVRDAPARHGRKKIQQRSAGSAGSAGLLDLMQILQKSLQGIQQMPRLAKTPGYTKSPEKSTPLTRAGARFTPQQEAESFGARISSQIDSPLLSKVPPATVFGKPPFWETGSPAPCLFQ